MLWWKEFVLSSWLNEDRWWQLHSRTESFYEACFIKWHAYRPLDCNRFKPFFYTYQIKNCAFFSHTLFNPGKNFLPSQKLWNDWCILGGRHDSANQTRCLRSIIRIGIQWYTILYSLPTDNNHQVVVLSFAKYVIVNVFFGLHIYALCVRGKDVGHVELSWAGRTNQTARIVWKACRRRNQD